MYYDDEARRFNFVSGLVFGAVLGAGLALLAAPQKRFRTPDRLRRASRSLAGRTAGRAGGVRDSVGGVLEAGRRILER